MSEPKSPAIPSWVWWVSAGLACCVVVGMVLFYVRHPDRSPFSDFAPHMRMGAPETNGHVPPPTTSVGVDSPFGEETGETG